MKRSKNKTNKSLEVSAAKATAAVATYFDLGSYGTGTNTLWPDNTTLPRIVPDSNVVSYNSAPSSGTTADYTLRIDGNPWPKLCANKNCGIAIEKEKTLLQVVAKVQFIAYENLVLESTFCSRKCASIWVKEDAILDSIFWKTKLPYHKFSSYVKCATLSCSEPMGLSACNITLTYPSISRGILFNEFVCGSPACVAHATDILTREMKKVVRDIYNVLVADETNE